MNSPATQATTQVQFSSEPAAPRKGSNLYRAKLSSADGIPVTGAQVSVRSYLPGMPQMGMAAMNVVTSLSEKGGGVYEGRASLDSDGAWQLTVTAIKGGAVLLTKQLNGESSHDLPRD
jgi:Cu(I)/Ag(I) efflux system membrane fusion protein/cobalt-zinc-cadmium efflux system membrane fusion protein